MTPAAANPNSRWRCRALGAAPGADPKLGTLLSSFVASELPNAPNGGQEHRVSFPGLPGPYISPLPPATTRTLISGPLGAGLLSSRPRLPGSAATTAWPRSTYILGRRRSTLSLLPDAPGLKTSPGAVQTWSRSQIDKRPPAMMSVGPSTVPSGMSRAGGVGPEETR